MNECLKDLKPEKVFKYFEALTEIPRESGNEAAVASYLEGFAKTHGLDVVRDEANNVIIKKPATQGYETAKSVILQGHTDMVCVKRDDLTFDFEKDPIPLVVDGDFVKTEGTTLGADNGIAVAMAMSILSDNTLEHPEITALFTTSEETGMDGVMALKPGDVTGDVLINIDSEEEGVVLASCAGGVNNITEIDVQTTPCAYDAAFELTISGLQGGHSGIEIGKKRANALKLLGRTMTIFKNHFSYGAYEAWGGEKMNAIAKTAHMKFALSNSDVFLMEDLVASIQETFKNEYAVTEPTLSITVSEIDPPETVFEPVTQMALEKLLRFTPFGVYAMSAGMEGLVETSNNLGVLEMKDGVIRLTNAVRSSVNSKKQALNELMALIAESIGAKNHTVADYPEWPFKVESPVRELMKRVYAEQYGEEMKVDAIHAGLECGFLKEKVGDIDMVSIGPNLYDVHTPYEHLSISSTERVYNFLVEVLKRMNTL